jgi:hypothetical protein
MSCARKLTAIAAMLAALFLTTPIIAQITFQTPNTAVIAPGGVQMCISAAGKAVACQSLNVNVNGTFSGADTTTAAATLAGVSGKTTYICGFQVSGLGATAATFVNIAVASVVGGNTLNFAYTFPAGVTVIATPVLQPFNPCVPANALGTVITVTVPGAAGNTSTNISAWGFQQ